jgi:hypothetical protein
MDGKIFALFFFMIVVGLPVMAGVWGDIQKRKMKLRERELELTSQHTAEKAAQYPSQSERLEQRVRVLERIITDKGLELADEIEALRDLPPQLAKPLN